MWFLTSDVPVSIFALLLPLGLISFILSLIIGHFLAEPLNILEKQVRAFAAGGDVTFTSDGRLHEADELASTISALVKKSASQQQDLVLREKRQGEFVSDVAHELRTPLTAIRGNADLLRDPDLPPALHDKFCGIIVEESERLSRLVNDLLALQHIEDGTRSLDLARVNLHDLAQSVLDALRPVLDERQANARVEGEAPDVLGDRDQLRQVISNLVDNASRFIEPGGHIVVELFGMRGNSIITVKDDGTGFGDIDPKLLFERFYRTDASRARGTGGTGLGLSIVKSIVEAHDGTVEALGNAVDEVLERAGLTIDDVSFIVPHQANERIIKYAAKKMKLPLDRFQISIAHRGNSSSACIPMTLSDAYEEGRIHPGDKVILVGFGGGFTSGAILYEA